MDTDINLDDLTPAERAFLDEGVARTREAVACGERLMADLDETLAMLRRDRVRS
jgi:hypothetical protein